MIDLKSYDFNPKIQIFLYIFLVYLNILETDCLFETDCLWSYFQASNPNLKKLRQEGVWIFTKQSKNVLKRKFLRTKIVTQKKEANITCLDVKINQVSCKRNLSTWIKHCNIFFIIQYATKLKLLCHIESIMSRKMYRYYRFLLLAVYW